MKFKKPSNIGIEEQKIVQKVLKEGVLSNFFADPKRALIGGKYVEKFEKKIEKFFDVKHAISVNSWTSGLVAILGAAGIRSGDQVILSPWTMSACFSCIIAWGGIPIFADIEEDTFCINPQEVEKKINKKTKAILAIDIFGQSADIQTLKKIAKKNNLILISDSAQAIGSKYKNRYTGTISDIGGFSFNFHKHIHTGEGGMIVTNNSKFARNCKFIRNHAEITNNVKNKKELINMIGYNLRMTELEAAIGIEQLKKLKKIVKKKQKIANHLKNKLKNLNGLILPYVRINCTHSYYVFAMKLSNKIKIPRIKIISNLKKLGVPVKDQYVNLLNLPIIKSKAIFNLNQFDKKNKFIEDNYNQKNYKVIKKLNEKSYISLNLCFYDYEIKDIDKIALAFKKTWQKYKL
tara:strand:- start:22920 stop:24134 length:1215 start_codon:yes stop_codon:yes gene_type:complete